MAISERNFVDPATVYDVPNCVPLFVQQCSAETDVLLGVDFRLSMCERRDNSPALPYKLAI